MNSNDLTRKGQGEKAVLLTQDAHSSASSSRQSPARIFMETTLAHLKPETAEQIATQARAYGLSVEDYVQRLPALARDVPRALGSGDTDACMAAMASLAEAEIPPLPRDFCRDHIYQISRVVLPLERPTLSGG